MRASAETLFRNREVTALSYIRCSAESAPVSAAEILYLAPDPNKLIGIDLCSKGLNVEIELELMPVHHPSNVRPKCNNDGCTISVKIPPTTLRHRALVLECCLLVWWSFKAATIAVRWFPSTNRNF